MSNWKIVDNPPNRSLGYRAIVDNAGDTICSPSPMGEANARLIAAAPELLIALQHIDSNAAESVEWIRRVARAAIAKAVRS